MQKFYNKNMKSEFNKNITYHFNHAFVRAPKIFGKVRLFQIGDLMCKNPHEIETHKQFCFELTCVLDGEVDCYINDTAFTLKKNSIILSLPNENHRIEITSSQGARFFFFGFDTLTNHPLYNEFEDLTKDGALIERTLKEKHNIIETLTKCLQEISSINAYSNILIEGYLNEILVLLLKGLKKDVTQGYRIKDKELLFANIISFIENNILEIGGINDVCKHFSFSESYLSHLFTAQLGISLCQYCQNVKFKKAMQMLDEGNSVTDVSEQLNYTSIYTFSRAFKNKFGISPSQYSRKKYKYNT